MQQILLILGGISLIGASFILMRRVHEIRTDGVSGIHNHDVYWPFNAIWRFVRETATNIFHKIYNYSEPYLHKWIGIIAARMFKISSWASYHFLRIYNLVHGKGNGESTKKAFDMTSSAKRD